MFRSESFVLQNTVSHESHKVSGSIFLTTQSPRLRRTAPGTFSASPQVPLPVMSKNRLSAYSDNLFYYKRPALQADCAGRSVPAGPYIRTCTRRLPGRIIFLPPLW